MRCCLKNWNRYSYHRACVHCFIDCNSGIIYQTLPWDHRAWHCGSGTKGSGNNTHIGIEICEPGCIKYTSGNSFSILDKPSAQAGVKRTYEAAVELCAWLCAQYELNPSENGTVISHKEGYERGIASNHSDPEHLWAGIGLAYNMDMFRQQVKAELRGYSPSQSINNGTNIKNCPFIVRINIDNLNIRSGPGTNYKKIGKYTGKGIFTIVEVKSGRGATEGWGKLKSGLGWISLNYTTRV